MFISAYAVISNLIAPIGDVRSECSVDSQDESDEDGGDSTHHQTNDVQYHEGYHLKKRGDRESYKQELKIVRLMRRSNYSAPPGQPRGQMKNVCDK